MHMKNMELYNFKTIVQDYITRPCGHAKGERFYSHTVTTIVGYLKGTYLVDYFYFFFNLNFVSDDGGETTKKHLLDERTHTEKKQF